MLDQGALLLMVGSGTGAVIVAYLVHTDDCDDFLCSTHEFCERPSAHLSCPFSLILPTVVSCVMAITPPG
jgi:hypothetical protein